MATASSSESVLTVLMHPPGKVFALRKDLAQGQLAVDNGPLSIKPTG
jgi:hypothetical protein